MKYRAPIQDMRFVLQRLVGVERLAALPGLAEVSGDLVEQILEEAGRFAEQEIAPLNVPGDRGGARFTDGSVRTPAGFKDAYRQFVEAGWPGLPFPEEFGGQNLPWAVAAAVSEMWHSASMSFALSPLLTEATADLLLAKGTDAQRARWLEGLVSGRVAGSMCLTEAQAGTDLAALRTRAVPDGERYRLSGSKIYITYGEHDLTEDIVYLVLARLPDAPPGTRGISLFLVPKILPDEEGGGRNDVRCVGIEHKLGIHGSPTCTLAFGEGEGALGWLIGRPHGGMALMFHMMNHARISVGLQGLAIAERAYQQADAFARERIQGQRRDGNGWRPAAIIEHPDVRRMLMTMRVQIDAMRALIYSVCGEHDVAQRTDDEAARERARGRVDLLTPIVKAWCTDLGFEIASLGIQVHGGMGYIEETGAAQHLRDARINMIYEGTNGVQALDLVARKLAVEDGRLPFELFEELRAELARSLDDSVRAPLESALLALETATRWLQAAGTRDLDAAAAGATPYLRMFGTIIGGFLLAKSARLARESDDPLAEVKEAASRFYAIQLVPPAAALLPAVTAGSEVLRAGLA